jgi:hypothetical protein
MHMLSYLGPERVGGNVTGIFRVPRRQWLFNVMGFIELLPGPEKVPLRADASTNGRDANRFSSHILCVLRCEVGAVTPFVFISRDTSRRWGCCSGEVSWVRVFNPTPTARSAAHHASPLTHQRPPVHYLCM